MTYPFTLIDTATGTYLDPTYCVLIPDEAATPLWLGDETGHSDSEVSEVGEGGGISIPVTFELVESIADALWGEGADTEWGPDTVEAIADAIQTQRPDLFAART